MAVPQKLLHSMLEALLDDLGYRGLKKSAEEILPQLHQQSGRRLESTEAKLARIESGGSPKGNALNNRKQPQNPFSAPAQCGAVGRRLSHPGRAPVV